jgi:hypothetical protein
MRFAVAISESLGCFSTQKRAEELHSRRITRRPTPAGHARRMAIGRSEPERSARSPEPSRLSTSMAPGGRASAPRARTARAVTWNSGTSRWRPLPARSRSESWRGRRCLPVPGQSKRRGSSEGRHATVARAPRRHVFAPTQMACLARKMIVGRAATTVGMHASSPRRSSDGRALWPVSVCALHFREPAVARAPQPSARRRRY